jgi:K+/H+ antiporter YhaU regulatory subunit KhtT
VAGQILAYQLLDEQPVQVENRIKFVRLSAGSLTGKHPWGHAELDQTGAKIIAVERNREVLVEFQPGFELRADDALFVCGSLNSLERYQRKFGGTSL